MSYSGSTNLYVELSNSLLIGKLKREVCFDFNWHFLLFSIYEKHGIHTREGLQIFAIKDKANAYR
jgi:hypothetical protein